MDSHHADPARGPHPRTDPRLMPALTLRQRTSSILAQVGWDLPMLPVVWSPRMRTAAGLFVLERDPRGNWRPEIRMSIPLVRRLDRPWPVEVCGCWCRNPESILQRILEHELLHYKLWRDGDSDWGHTERFRQLAHECFHHQGIRHGIGRDD